VSQVNLSQYRPNVGMALFNKMGLVFIGRRVGYNGQFAWQMPQGGVDRGEDFAAAAQRELFEEAGVDSNLIEEIGTIDEWLTYDFPPNEGGRYRGQKQRWFAYRFHGKDRDIRLDLHKPEFADWRWAVLSDTPQLVIPFKKKVYEEVARRFAPFANPAE
jgi:putative (di)nucleoside polyphosphate hydrolase